ncbi:MAG: tyrosine-type recombinase/integrase [bacterium]|nr:tyrosine-type recombinase/integrase [bacterium]
MIKKSWWIDFRANHTRHRKRSPQNSKAGAQAYEAMLRGKLARGESIEREEEKTQSQEPTFGQFAQRWFEEYVVPNSKPSTQYSRKCILFPSLVPFFGKTLINRIAVGDIEKYKAQLLKKGLARKTVNEHLLVLNNCVSKAYQWLRLEGKPPEITWLKCPPPKTDYLSFDESELLLSHVEGTMREMILTALKTGMRLGELIGLQWSSIDWDNRLIVVRHSWCPYSKRLGSPKSNRERHIDMTADLYGMLLKKKKATGFVFLDADGKPSGPYCLGRKLASLCKKAGLRHIGWHVLRHTFASHLVMRGAPLAAVQKLMGHSSIEMTMRYTHLAPSTLRTAIDLLNPMLTLPKDFGQPVGNRWLEAQVKTAS